MKKILPYFLPAILSLVVFCLIFQMWKVDLTLPTFNYNNDGLFSIFIIKNIINTGYYACSDKIGVPHLTEQFCLYDFPMQSDMFHMMIVKFIALFTGNPFLVANIFFIMTFMLISTTSFIALRQFGVGVLSALLVGVLYAFVPYHFVRNVWHLFLSNYALIPLSIMVALWIAQDKIGIFYVNAKQQYAVRSNKFFFISLAIAVFAAGNNIYYAYYSCVVFVFVWFLNGLRKGKFFGDQTIEVGLLCLATFLTLFYLYIPTLFYQLSHGFNPYLAGRGVAASEVFGLKIIDLFMPVSNHYLDYLANERINLDFQIDAGWERISESLGFISSVGFMFLFVWFLGRDFNHENSLISQTIKKLSFSTEEKTIISYLAKINVFILLFATVGGLVMFISLAFPTLRSHARFAIFVSFISLFLVAMIFDKIVEGKIFGKKIYAQILIIFISVLAILDQVGKVSSDTAQSKGLVEKFYSDRDFIAAIENSVPEKSMIFVLPQYGFPEDGYDDYRSVIAYAHSKNLRWSYPVVAGRESFFWQQKAVNGSLEFFLKTIKEAGFVGVYLDKEQYSGKNGTKNWMKLDAFMIKHSKAPKLVSKNKNLIFYQI